MRLLYVSYNSQGAKDNAEIIWTEVHELDLRPLTF